MNIAGILMIAIIAWLESVIFACLRKSLTAGVFYLARPNYLVHFLPEKTSEGE
jgi:hypothetical protein